MSAPCAAPRILYIGLYTVSHSWDFEPQGYVVEIATDGASGLAPTTHGGRLASASCRSKIGNLTRSWLCRSPAPPQKALESLR
jgi:hypothetical protein